MLDALKDSEIVRRILQGEANAFGLLLDRYKGHALMMIKRRIPAKDVEDIAQEVFVKAYQSLPGFDPDSHFKKWLSIIAVRTCCDYWRKAYRTRESPMSALSERHAQWLDGVISSGSTDSEDGRARQEEIRPIIMAFDKKASDLKVQFRPQMKQLHDQVTAQIRIRLDEKQKRKFDEINKKLLKIEKAARRHQGRQETGESLPDVAQRRPPTRFHMEGCDRGEPFSCIPASFVIDGEGEIALVTPVRIDKDFRFRPPLKSIPFFEARQKTPMDTADQCPWESEWHPARPCRGPVE